VARAVGAVGLARPDGLLIGLGDGSNGSSPRVMNSIYILIYTIFPRQ
jgi:hypothetical protein